MPQIVPYQIARLKKNLLSAIPSVACTILVRERELRRILSFGFGPCSRHGTTTELWDSLQIAVAPIFANFSHALY